MARLQADARGLTIAALATPWGRSGVAVVRISGKDAAAILQGLTQRPLPQPRVASLRKILDDDGEVLDQALVLWFPAPHSFTGEDVVELHLHGSPVIIERVLERIYALGARPAGPGEFTRRAVEHGKLDLTQAEAVAAAIEAATLRAAKQAQKQLAGKLGERIQALMDAITDLVAHLEALLDFPEEDIPEGLDFAARAEAIIQDIDRALRTADFGERLFRGLTLVILGPPNVGKSSLLNRLAGEERAIVSSIPGTTRDAVEAQFAVRGVPVRVLDTAGIRETPSDPIEQEGIRRALKAAQRADVVLWVAEATDPVPPQGVEATLWVANKADLLTPQAQAAFDRRWLLVSAKTGFGLDALLARLAEACGEAQAEGEDVWITRARHRELLLRARAALAEGKTLADRPETMDLAAAHFRRAYAALAEILGVGDVEAILDRVFSSFCIGK